MSSDKLCQQSETETEGEGRCLICYNELNQHNEMNPKRRNNAALSLLEKQLSVMHLFRNLFKLPLSFCENLLVKRGNPSSWVPTCWLCSTLITTAFNEYSIILKIQKQLQKAKEKYVAATTKIMCSIQLSNKVDNIIKQEFGTVENIRSFIFNHVQDELTVNDSGSGEARHFDIKIEPNFYSYDFLSGGCNDFDSKIFGEQSESANDVFDNEDYLDSDNLHPLEGSDDVSNINKDFNPLVVRNAKKCVRRRRGRKRKRKSVSVPDPQPVKTLEMNLRKTKRKQKFPKFDDFYDDEDKKDKDWEPSDNSMDLSTALTGTEESYAHPCYKCNCKFSFISQLREHFGKMHSDCTFNPQNLVPECEYCGIVYTSPSAFTNHMEEFHRSGTTPKFLCSLCNKTFKDQDKLLSHRHRQHRKELDLPRFTCPQCSKEYMTEKNLKLHITVEHDKKFNFYCKVCNTGFLEFGKLKRHEQTHDNPEKVLKHKCKHCDLKFSNAPKRIRHTREVHLKELPYSCDHCDESFVMREDLKKHLAQNHPGFTLPPYEQFQGPCMCEICAKTFKHKSSLKIHMLSHTKEACVKCELCDQEFHNESYLKRHRTAKHYEELNLQPLKCPECEKVITGPDGMKKHMTMMHTKNFKMCCEICGKGFLNNCVMQYHIRSQHTGERPFACTYCEMRFFGKSSLNKHLQTHTGYKYHCDKCPKGFPSKHNLNRHAKRHKSPPPNDVGNNNEQPPQKMAPLPLPSGSAEVGDNNMEGGYLANSLFLPETDNGNGCW